MSKRVVAPAAPSALPTPPQAPVIDAAPEFTPDGTADTKAVAAPPLPAAPKPVAKAAPKRAVRTQETRDEAPEPVVGNEAYNALLDPPDMQMSQSNHLRYLKKKVHDGLVEPARGVVVGTGIIGVDMILQRGVNFGSCHEFFGFSKTAKSYLMQKIGVEAQRTLPDCYVVVLDRENAYDRDRVLSVGFDQNRTIIIPSRMIPEPDHVFDVMREQTEEIERLHLRMLEKMSDEDDDDAAKDDPTNKKEAKKKGKDLYCRDYDVEKSPHILFIIDSLPAFSEQEDVVEDQGRRAKKWHAVLRRVTGFLDAKIMVLFSNHVIYKPGMFGGPTKTSGLSPDYYRDCGIELHRMADLRDENDVVIGTMIHATVDKTRRGASGGNTFFPIYFKGGAPRFSGIMPYAKYLDLAEVTNEKAFKEGKWKVWANYRIKGVTGTISEKDPAALEAYVRANNVLPMIGAKEKESIR